MDGSSLDGKLEKRPKPGFRMLKMAAGCLLAAACFGLAFQGQQAEVKAADVPAQQRIYATRQSTQNAAVHSMRHAAGGLFFRMPETTWQKSLASALKRADDPLEELGAGGKKRRASLEAGRGLSGLEQLKAVNAFWNKIPWRSDEEVWGREDKWAAPGEFALRGGDCEDYAVAKFWTLKELGWPRDRLFVMLWRKDKSSGLDAHAALAVMDNDGTVWILDREGAPLKLADMRRKRGAPAYVCAESRTWILAAKESMPADAMTAERKAPAKAAAPRVRPRRTG